MQHVDALTILGRDISSMINKKPNQVHVAMESCEVKSCEAIVTTAVNVNPSLKVVFAHFLVLFVQHHPVASLSAASIHLALR